MWRDRNSQERRQGNMSSLHWRMRGMVGSLVYEENATGGAAEGVKVQCFIRNIVNVSIHAPLIWKKYQT